MAENIFSVFLHAQRNGPKVVSRQYPVVSVVQPLANNNLPTLRQTSLCTEASKILVRIDSRNPTSSLLNTLQSSPSNECLPSPIQVDVEFTSAIMNCGYCYVDIDGVVGLSFT